MILVILDVETKLANLDFFTYHALVLCFIYQISFATWTFETSVVLWQPFSTSCRTTNELTNCLTTEVLLYSFFLLFLKSLAIFVQNVKPLWAPISTTEWTLEGFTICLVMFEAAFETICVYLTTATIQTVWEVFRFSECITANATCFVVFKWARWHLCTFRLFSFLPSSDPDASISYCSICVSSNILRIEV